MIVQVVLIQMGADNDLIPFTKQPLGKFQPNSVRLLWCDLPRLKGLDEMVAENAARLFVFLFRFLHGSKGGFGRPAVQRGHKAHSIGFLWVSGVDDPLVQLGLFPIDGVLHAVVQPCADGEYLGVCHVTAAPRCSRSFPAPP